MGKNREHWMTWKASGVNAGVGNGGHHVHLTCHTKGLGYHKYSRK